jgi:hypothetical protein
MPSAKFPTLNLVDPVGTARRLLGAGRVALAQLRCGNLASI